METTHLDCVTPVNPESMVLRAAEGIIQCEDSFNLQTASYFYSVSVKAEGRCRGIHSPLSTLLIGFPSVHAKQSWSCRWSFLLRLSASIIQGYSWLNKSFNS